MPNVFILGATGSVGLPLAQSLTRSGNHTVYGLARSPAKAKLLAQHEIVPVLGDAGDSQTLTSTLESTPIDIVVDASSAYEHTAAVFDAVVSFARTRAQTLKGDGIDHAPRVAYVYVSGTWVHGSSDRPASDLSPVASKSLSTAEPAKAITWRPGHEQRVLAAAGSSSSSDAPLDVAIVRPCMVYGGASWSFGALFQPLVDAKRAGGTDAVKVPLAPDATVVVQHVDDVVDALHRAVDRVGGGGLGSWPVFDLVAEAISIRAMAEAGAKALGLKGGVELVGTGGDVMLDAVSTSAAGLRSERANMVLGWVPKRRNMVGDMGRILAAFEAHAAEKK